MEYTFILMPGASFSSYAVGSTLLTVLKGPSYSGMTYFPWGIPIAYNISNGVTSYFHASPYYSQPISSGGAWSKGSQKI